MEGEEPRRATRATLLLLISGVFGVGAAGMSRALRGDEVAQRPAAETRFLLDARVSIIGPAADRLAVQTDQPGALHAQGTAEHVLDFSLREGGPW